MTKAECEAARERSETLPKWKAHFTGEHRLNIERMCRCDVPTLCDMLERAAYVIDLLLAADVVPESDREEAREWLGEWNS